MRGGCREGAKYILETTPAESSELIYIAGLKLSVDLQSSNQSNEGLFVKTQGLRRSYPITAVLSENP